MRILLIGGFIDYQIQLANQLSKMGNTVMMIACSNSIEEHIESIDHNINIYTAKKIYSPKNLFEFSNITKKINEFDPDVIHLQAGGGMLALFLLPLYKKKVPIVSTFHDVKPHIGEDSWFRNFIRHWINKYSDKIIVHGKKLKEQMIEEYDIVDDKVYVTMIGMHNILPFKKYEKKDLKEDGNLVMFFGRIYKYKGLDYLIKAQPLIKKEFPSAKIIIAGKGENFKKYENMMMNRNDFIIFNNHISYKDGSELFQRCSIVVLPYIDASQSGVIPTAYGFKKPIVSTNVGSIPEIIDDGITGIIVPPKDSKALADAIIKLLRDDKLRIQMGRDAYIKLNRDLSWDKIAEKTIKVYEDAIKMREIKNID